MQAEDPKVTDKGGCTCIQLREGIIRDPTCTAQNHNRT